jgi:hypothetical protein
MNKKNGEIERIEYYFFLLFYFSLYIQMETASLTIETDPPASEEKDLIDMLLNYMKQVEKYKSKTISGKEKKLYVKKQLKNIFKKTYDDYEAMIDAMIDMICYIAKHKDMLDGINMSGLMKMKCCSIF